MEPLGACFKAAHRFHTPISVGTANGIQKPWKRAKRYAFFRMGGVGRLDLAKHFGTAVRRHRELLRLSQEELADRAGLDRSFVGRVERNEQNASLTTMQRLSQALGSDLDVIFATAREIAANAGQP